MRCALVLRLFEFIATFLARLPAKFVFTIKKQDSYLGAYSTAEAESQNNTEYGCCITADLDHINYDDSKEREFPFEMITMSNNVAV